MPLQEDKPTPDIETILNRAEHIVGASAVNTKSVAGGYTAAYRSIVEFANGLSTFVKAGTDDLTASWLRAEYRIYKNSETEFMPKLIGWHNEKVSLNWRQDFIRTYLERDIALLGPRIPPETLRRFWTMLAHCHGQPFNAARIASSLAVSGVTVARYLDLMVDLLLVRRLSPWMSNVGKRLVRSLKIYVRDCGILHALLNISTNCYLHPPNAA